MNNQKELNMFGLSRDTLVRIGLWTVFSLVVIFGIRSCSSGSSGSVGNGIWILFFAGLIVAAVVSRERPYLALTFSGLAVLVFLVLLGNFDGLFDWKVLGLPLLAAAGIYGAMKTDGRTRAFLGFASGMIILAWMYMFAQATLKVDLGFLGNRKTDPVNLIIGLLAVGIFAFAAWRRNWIFFVISFVVLAAWLGPDVANRIQTRFPSQLSVSQETKDDVGDILDSLRKRAKDAVKPGPMFSTAPTPAVTSPPAMTPKKTGERAIRMPLIGGKTEIRKGEYAEFEFDNSPSRLISRYQIVFQIEGSTPARHYLQVVGWPETFDYRQTGTGPVIFFDKFGSGRIGEPKFFRPGKVKVRLWSDSEIRVLSSHVELIYTE
jgi:hypothetical protein